MRDEGRRSGERRGFAETFWPALRAALDGIDGAAVAAAAAALARACREGGTVFALGNGGSAATASHFASDLDAVLADPGLPPSPARVTCLADNVPRLTAIANDHGYADVFARRLRAAARPGDVVVLFSVSGASENLHRAAAAARELGAATIGVFGAPAAGTAQPPVDHRVAVPSADFAVVESVHAALEHVLAGEVRAHLAARP